MKKAAGSTNVFVPMHLRANSTVTDFDITYTREGDTPSAKVDMTAGTIAAHADNTAVYIDPTNAPELVQICPPDAAFAPGVDSVVISIHNPEEGWHIDKEIQLVVDFSKYQGKVYFDNNAAANTGTVLGIDGTPDNPVTSWAAVQALADALGTKHIVVNGLLDVDTDALGYTFTATRHERDGTNINQVRFQVGATQDVFGCTFENVSVLMDQGVSVDSGNLFKNCEITTQSLNPIPLGGKYYDCWFSIPDFDYELFANTTIINGQSSTGISRVKFIITDASSDLIIDGFASSLITIDDITTSNRISIFRYEGKIQLDSGCTGGNIDLNSDCEVDDSSNNGTAINFNVNVAQRKYNGAIWLDAAASNTNTVFGVDGTPMKPVSDMPSAITLAASLGTKTIKVKGSVSVAVDVSGHNIEAWDSSALLTGSASVNYASCTLKGLRINGLFAGNYLTTNLFDCEILGTTGDLQCAMYRCLIGGTVLTGTNLVRFIDCFGNFTLDYSGSSTALEFFNHSGAVNITNFSPAEGTLEVYSNGSTKIELEASCTAGTATFRGIGVLVDDSAGTTVDVTEWESIPLASISNVNVTQWDGNPVTGDGDWAELQTDVDTALTNQAAINTNIDDNEVKIDQVITDIAALNNISTADVLAQINAALDAANTALVGIPNAETGSIRKLIQMMAQIQKGKKVETATEHKVLKEGEASTFGTRTISSPLPGQLDVGELE